MAILRTSLAAFALVCAAYCSQTPVSALDQYSAHEDWPHPPQLFSEATDKSFKIRKSHRFNLTPKKPIKNEFEKNDIVPELQVGCGEGFIETSTVSSRKTKKHSEKSYKLRRKRSADMAERRIRSFFRINDPYVRTPSSLSYTIWKAPSYQISRPYFIPVLGGSGRLPIYFPPQPVLINPGFPLHNPPKRTGLGYLPPKSSTQPPIRNRFGMDDDDDRPYWGPAAPSITEKPTTTQVTPTRRTRRPGHTTTHPPLAHSNSKKDVPNPLALESDKALFDSLFTQPPPTTTRRPKSPPSRCVWAIVSCCSASSGAVNENCFEQLGCPGAFWGASPCNSEFARAAIENALNYYDAK